MKRLLPALLFGAVGFLLNAQSYPVWRNVELFFGSIASLACAVLLGPWWGGLAALLAFAPLGMRTGHLYEVPAFVLEAFVVGLLVHRRQFSVIASVAIYWLIAAIWVSILLALFTLQEPSHWLWSGTPAYPLGSLIAAVFLEFLFILIPLEKSFGRPAVKKFRHVLFVLLAGFVLAPALVITYRLGQWAERSTAKRLEREMELTSALVLQGLKGFFASNRPIIEAGINREWISSDRAAYPDIARELLKKIGQPLVEIHLTRPNGCEFHISEDEFEPGHQWREELVRLHPLKEYTYSKPFQLPAPLSYAVAAIYPVDSDRYLVTVWDLWSILRATDHVHPGAEFALFDSNGEVVFSTIRSTSIALREMLQAAGARTGLLDLNSVVRKGVGEDEALPFVYRAGLGELPWQLLLISSKTSFEHELRSTYYGYFAAVLVSLGVAFGLSYVAARKYTQIREVDTLLRDSQSTKESLEQSRDRLRQSLRQVEEQKLQGARAYDELQRTLAQLRQTQSHLLQAEKLAALGEMLRRIAHEVNNPLTAVIGYSELMLKYGVERSDENLQTILSQGQRCKEIIRALLEFSRQSESVRGPVSLVEVLEKVRSLVEHQFTVHDMEFEIMIPRDLPLILADPQKLVQVFLNLANNAYDALGEQTEATKRFSIGAYQSGDSVYVVVSDTGTGIPASIKDKIFDPFFTTKPIGKGTGLGLSAVYGILKEHNAEIRCESEPGEGSQFFIRFPIISSPAEEVTVSGSATPAPAGSVLIVDDEKSILNLVQEYLESAGYAVQTCENGLEALHCLQRENYDLLITDLWMPGMSGFELYESCRNSAGLKNLKVLFISGDPDEEVRAKIEQLSAHLVSKPFTRSELLSNVFALLIS